MDGKGSDKSSIARCFETFGLILTDNDHMPAAQATAAQAVAAQADPNFVGRESAIADLTALVSRKVNVIVIQARGGVGKTTLARKYLQQEFGSYLEFPIAKETKDIASIEGLIEEKLRQLGEEPGREFFVSLDRLKRKLQSDRIGILIDNLEPALDSTGKFIEAHRRYLELLRVLNDPTVQSLTLITTRERLREPAITVHYYGLKSLDVQAWSQFFQSRNISAPPSTTTDGGEQSALAALHNAYGGNAKAMDLISGVILEDFSGQTEAYWQANQNDLLVERDLEDLVTNQFNRLQQLDSDAYNLLCRMGCYRYQDVPTVPIEGVFCLLWDIPENRHRRVIKSLQDRSLIDCENGEFWLHPVIRAEAIARLRISETWEITSREAARFWTEGTITVETLEDALRAFEAYHHYFQINELEAAAEVILKRRTVKEARGNICLGDSFYRLGLLQQALISINQVINAISSKLSLATMYITLGDIHWGLGDIQRGFEFQEKVETIITEYLKSSHVNEKDLWRAERLNIYSLIARSIYNIDIEQLEDAQYLLDKAINLSKKYGFERSTKKALFCLVFVKTSLNLTHDAHILAEELYRDYFVESGTKISTFYMSFLALAYKKLGNHQKALEIYQKIMLELEESHYSQAKARTLCGMSEIYYEQKAFSKSCLLNLEAIKLLNEVGAKLYLAKALHQSGLTYQAIGETDKSGESFQEAIRLFSEMDAPKQVERVRRSMQN
ncbi:ATP-binding protein [Phormidium sp. CLA17]|uniref:tetratricopeptide repeat protein n=1 Tax=Leptolyngbya sp. Cla-17 TaxID=2803751 RepID=UPI0019322DDD|nr:tetratricopeptide repeat protein [Leptolyngbya sp. Cla-17]MBM0742477.1 ATP-binding protein [Leptolyngbya sp. Cla-17]